jgi:hypothetical protein
MRARFSGTDRALVDDLKLVTPVRTTLPNVHLTQAIVGRYRFEAHRLGRCARLLMGEFAQRPAWFLHHLIFGGC